ncbi:SOS response-associated peptidase [Brevibacillus dissolubilis]|uniref:SOS response-associated peptidase n=1 Tax=Brevibacillus dissolubilis TaxID=1844116 RepID=UPI0011173C1B|nr:SOS response-associated peptidase [Brevibacillus dissolubilis]
MCGRFTLVTEPDKLMERFMLEQIGFELRPRYNIAPGQLVLAIIGNQGERRIGQLKWGLVPFWAKDEKIGYKMINAKSETIREKPAFKRLFTRKRCIIPADGFYEWKQTGDGKQPMRIMLTDGGLFSMAALYDTWENPDGQQLHTCTVITTKPNDIVADIHDRMPVILRPEDEAIWLDRENADEDLLQSLLVPYESSKMKAYPVSTMVGNVRNDVPECILEWSGT